MHRFPWGNGLLPHRGEGRPQRRPLTAILKIEHYPETKAFGYTHDLSRYGHV